VEFLEELCRSCRLLAGVDLAVSRPSTIALVDQCGGSIVVLDSTNDRLIELLKRCKPLVVAVDAPITKPEGGYARELERAAWRRGFKLLPPMMGGMSKLTEVGVKLREELSSISEVIETHPRSAAINAGIEPREFALDLLDVPLPRDWNDAIISAFVALAYHLGEFDVVRASDGELYLLPKSRSFWRRCVGK